MLGFFCWLVDLVWTNNRKEHEKREKKIQCTVHLNYDFFVIVVASVVVVVVAAAAVGLFRIKYISLCRLHGSFVHLFVKFSQNLAHFFIYFVSSLTDTHTATTRKPPKKLNRKQLKFWNRRTSVRGSSLKKKKPSGYFFCCFCSIFQVHLML